MSNKLNSIFFYPDPEEHKGLLDKVLEESIKKNHEPKEDESNLKDRNIKHIIIRHDE